MLRADRRLLALATCLSALAGFVDSLGFLQAGGFFVSFMSGNSTRLAVGISHGSVAAITAAGLILGFTLGVMLGTIVGHHAGGRRRPMVLAMVTLLLLIAAILSDRYGTIALACMVLAMGAENAALADKGEVKVGLTYMTGALVRIGQAIGLRLVGQTPPHWTADLALWAGLVSGAIAGAAAFRLFGLGALWFAVGLSALLTLAATRLQPPR